MSKHELEAIVADIGARLERMKVWRKRFGEESPIVVNDLDPISALFTRCLSTISERMVDKAGAWSCFPNNVPLKPPETPRGEVTDAMVSDAVDAYVEVCPPAYGMPYVPALRAALEAALSARPKQQDTAGEVRREAVPAWVAARLLAARDAHIEGDYSEVWHQIYMIAAPTPDPYVEPWAELERIASTQPLDKAATVERDKA